MQIEFGQALIIDDEFYNRDFAAKLLERAGFQVVQAKNGHEAISLARSMRDLTLAIVDMEMPDMDGLEVVEHLSQHYPEVMLVMATVHDDTALIERAFQAGVSIFMIKPNGFIELYHYLIEKQVDENLFTQRWIADVGGLRLYRGMVLQMTL